jgi:hypothetical protein
MQQMGRSSVADDRTRAIVMRQDVIDPEMNDLLEFWSRMAYLGFI